jgi:hypothetical protein
MFPSKIFIDESLFPWITGFLVHIMIKPLENKVFISRLAHKMSVNGTMTFCQIIGSSRHRRVKYGLTPPPQQLRRHPRLVAMGLKRFASKLTNRVDFRPCAYSKTKVKFKIYKLIFHTSNDWYHDGMPFQVRTYLSTEKKAWSCCRERGKPVSCFPWSFHRDRPIGSRGWALLSLNPHLCNPLNN